MYITTDALMTMLSRLYLMPYLFSRKLIKSN